MSVSVWSYGLWPTRLLYPWDSSGKKTGVGIPQGIFPIQGSKLHLLQLLHWLCCAVLSHLVVSDSVTPRTVARQAPLSMGILQARILEWVAMTSSRGSSQPRDRTQVSCTAGRCFTVWATRESPWILEWVVYPFSRGNFQTQELNRGLPHCRRVCFLFVLFCCFQADALPTELPGKSQVGSLPLEPPGKPCIVIGL